MVHIHFSYWMFHRLQTFPICWANSFCLFKVPSIESLKYKLLFPVIPSVPLTDHCCCLSVAGFEGRQCEGDITECASGPCLHGGRCVERSWQALYGSEPLLPVHYDPRSAGGFICSCPPGTTGNLSTAGFRGQRTQCSTLSKTNIITFLWQQKQYFQALYLS